MPVKNNFIFDIKSFELEINPGYTVSRECVSCYFMLINALFVLYNLNKSFTIANFLFLFFFSICSAYIFLQIQPVSNSRVLKINRLLFIKKPGKVWILLIFAETLFCVKTMIDDYEESVYKVLPTNFKSQDSMSDHINK